MFTLFSPSHFPPVIAPLIFTGHHGDTPRAVFHLAADHGSQVASGRMEVLAVEEEDSKSVCAAGKGRSWYEKAYRVEGDEKEEGSTKDAEKEGEKMCPTQDIFTHMGNVDKKRAAIGTCGRWRLGKKSKKT